MFPSTGQLILWTLLLDGVRLLALVFLTEAGPASEHALFGALTLKEERPTGRGHLSNYERVKDTKAAQGALRYKVQRRKENPFFSLYRQEQPPQSSPPPRQGTPPPRRAARQRAFYDVTNSDVANQSLFSAVFRERQSVRPAPLPRGAYCISKATGRYCA